MLHPVILCTDEHGYARIREVRLDSFVSYVQRGRIVEEPICVAIVLFRVLDAVLDT